MLSIMKHLVPSVIAVAGIAAISSAGVISVNTGGIDGSFMQWDVPLIQPGVTWSRDFSFTGEGGLTYVEGYIEAGVSASGRGAWLILTDFKLGGSTGSQLNFEFDANIDFGTLFSGWANPFQEFRAEQHINSGNDARIDWAKGAVWNGAVLPPIAGFYQFGNLQSDLSDSSGRFDFFTSPINLESRTTIQLITGGMGDEVWLPDSATDTIWIPAPSAGIALAGAMLVTRKRRG